jgi:hypothetical protein
MQPMPRHAETVGLRPDVACEYGSAFIFRCAEFRRPRLHLVFSGCATTAKRSSEVQSTFLPARDPANAAEDCGFCPDIRRFACRYRLPAVGKKS